MKNVVLLFMFIYFCNACSDTLPTAVTEPVPIEIDAITSVATRDPIDLSHVTEIHKRSGADYFCLVPYGFMRKDEVAVHFNLEDKQWWGETETGLRENIRLCRERGVHIILKPQVWAWNHWTGDYDFDTEEDWQKWESDYTDFILFFAKIAEEQGVEMYVMGTEFKNAIKKRPEYWSGLIQEVRKVYSGTLTYASNWDNYMNIPFWSQLDLIGINAYFPLSQSRMPEVDELVEAWQPIRKDIAAYAKSENKKVLFTEYGYLSVDGCAWNTWELEANIDNVATNEQAQANAFEALFRTFSREDYWLGGVLWKWFPQEEGRERFFEKDYTPQYKLGEDVIHKWYMRDSL